MIPFGSFVVLLVGLLRVLSLSSFFPLFVHLDLEDLLVIINFMRVGQPIFLVYTGWSSHFNITPSYIVCMCVLNHCDCLLPLGKGSSSFEIDPLSASM